MPPENNKDNSDPTTVEVISKDMAISKTRSASTKTVWKSNDDAVLVANTTIGSALQQKQCHHPAASASQLADPFIVLPVVVAQVLMPCFQLQVLSRRLQKHPNVSRQWIQW
jgi:hypothetical protein